MFMDVFAEPCENAAMSRNDKVLENIEYATFINNLILCVLYVTTFAFWRSRHRRIKINQKITVTHCVVSRSGWLWLREGEIASPRESILELD